MEGESFLGGQEEEEKENRDVAVVEEEEEGEERAELEGEEDEEGEDREQLGSSSRAHGALKRANKGFAWSKYPADGEFIDF